ncbi:dipeptidase [Clostridium tetani]|uniref:dipeptidase n=1 Tax=Clostridium tetani TaxID=1513 RepID=UPI000513EA80|nr:dipeptidase [Clostridium tetani]KGI38115.1 peptidase M19 [Clostridium tetani ATCC 9441]KGI41966.1 peptidase M19 [Clostridium tetani]RXI45137.1 membrane dipeptidase [Clostridium tetani]RXI49682.1 membrane dipeptidase [Clostridium tetani]RXI54617.1 membrane dipeptidase [Clostridium tetani]
MSIIDLHCDTIYKITNCKDKINLKDNNISIDLNKMRKGKVNGEFFALFIDREETETPLKTCNKMLDKFYEEMDKNKEIIKLTKNYTQYKENIRNNIMSAFLTIEGGEALEGEIYNLRNFYRLGVRLLTLTWNYENEIGYPNCNKIFMQKGLKKFGIEIVEEMNRLGMIIDVSHLSDGGFYDVAKYSKVPFIASHSNARSITNHGRNLTDDMIKILSEKGGVIGINFCNEFLGDTEISRVEDMITHIKYIKNTGGIDCIALGSDFDGIDCEVEIEDISQMDKLIEKLSSSGFNESEIERICFKNAERVIKEVLK